MVSPLFRSIQQKNKKGFTLIELLVVISIVAMLSSIVLVSLKKARDKALDTKVKSQLRNLKTAAEVYKSKRTDGTYGPVVFATDGQIRYETIANGCSYGMFADPEVAPYLLTINNPPFVSDPDVSGNTVHALCMSVGSLHTDPLANRYFVVVKLSDGSWYCVDSVGSPVTRPVSSGNPVGNRISQSNAAATNPAIGLYTWYILMDDCNYMLNCA